MNTLKELKLLARMQAAQGIEDGDLLGRIAIEEQKIEQQQLAEQAVSESRKNAFQSMFADLSKDIGKLLADEKKKTEEEQQLLDRFATVLNRIDEIKETQPEAILEAEPVVEPEQVL